MSLTKLGRSGWRYFAEKIATGREDYFARSRGARCTCMAVLSKRMYLPASSFRAATNRPSD